MSIFLIKKIQIADIQSCVPVFRPNVREVTIAPLSSAVRRVAILVVEAACPPIGRKRACHRPSGSHCPLEGFTEISQKRLTYTDGTQKYSGLKFGKVVHVKNPGKRRRRKGGLRMMIIFDEV